MIRKGSTHGGRGGLWLSSLAGLALAAAALWLGKARAADPSPQGEQAAQAETADTWRLKGRVVDDRGQPVAKAEVLLLGEEGIIVDAPGLKWFVFPQVKGPKPASRRTDQQGQFEIERAGGGNRVAILAKDLSLWVVDRQKLPAGDPVEIKLPRSGSLAVELDLPGKPAEQEVLIELCTFDGATWNRDKLRRHFGTKAKNPGKTVFEHLPPATYAVERNVLTKTDPQTTLMTQCDRQLVRVEPGAEATVRIDRRVGRPLKGHIAGLQDVPLAYAHLTIHYFGPEEGIGPSGKPRRQMTALDIIPITSGGVFTTDPIPQGDYWIDLFAARADNPEGDQSDFKLKPDSKSSGGQYRFTVPAEGEMPPIELTAVVNPHASPARPATSMLRVVGTDGKPVARFEVSLLSSETNVRGWFPGVDGQVSLATGLRLHEGPMVSLVVRAEGFAASITRFAGDELEKLRGGGVTITLDPGQEVELALRCRPAWPGRDLRSSRSSVSNRSAKRSGSIGKMASRRPASI